MTVTAVKRDPNQYEQIEEGQGSRSSNQGNSKGKVVEARPLGCFEAHSIGLVAGGIIGGFFITIPFFSSIDRFEHSVSGVISGLSSCVLIPFFVPMGALVGYKIAEIPFRKRHTREIHVLPSYTDKIVGITSAIIASLVAMKLFTSLYQNRANFQGLAYCLIGSAWVVVIVGVSGRSSGQELVRLIHKERQHQPRGKHDS
jgi:hypothetical protein